MKIELRKDYKYALLVPTSMGVRLTPAGGQPVHCSDNFLLHATSAESNVVSVSSYLGLPVKVLTTFVKGSPIARFIKDNLASRHIDFEGSEVDQGGPWGFRHQINIADSGFGTRGPRVHNDRAGEVGRTLNVKDFDLDNIFGKQGVQIVHLSGLIGSFSPETSTFRLQLARAGISDILVGNEEDFQLCLGIEGPEAGGKELAEKIESFKVMINRAKKAFPNASVYATTLRQVVSTNTHLWGAIMAEGDNWHVVEPREIPVLDRIGGGDGFVGGLLYAILRGWEPEKWVQFGWATGALVTTLLTDYAQPADEEQIWSIWEGNARVRR